MLVNIKRIDKELPLPKYETDGAVGFDILAREDTEILPGKVALIPGNLIVETPPGYMLVLASRSSTPKKKGLLTPHGIGVLDQDFCGPDDELKIQVYNFTSNPVTVLRGEKVAQGVFVPIAKANWNELEEVTNATRGGFGSTDGKN